MYYSFRTFTAVHLTERTLLNIYSVGLGLLDLNMCKCQIRNLPPNMFFFLPNLRRVGKLLRSFLSCVQCVFTDLSNNFLCSLPNSLSHHAVLEEIYLSGNLFTSFPIILDTIPNLKYHDLVHLLFLDYDVAEEHIEVKDEMVCNEI